MRFGLDTPPLAAVRRAARTQGCTVHAYFLAALLRAVDGLEGRRRRRRIIDLFSFRRLAGPAAADWYDTLVLPFTLTLRDGGDEAALLADIDHALRVEKDGGVLAEFRRQQIYAAAAACLPKRLATALVARFVAKSNLIATNPGVIDLPLEGFGPIPIRDFYNLSQLFPPGRMMWIFNTFRGRLRLTVVYDRQAVDAAALTALVAHWRAALDALPGLGRGLAAAGAGS